jgi:rapamycin-insensitive companion of mTOR
MFEESTQGSNLSRKGTLLMAEILQRANKVLPLNVAAEIQVYSIFPFVLRCRSDDDEPSAYPARV